MSRPKVTPHSPIRPAAHPATHKRYETSSKALLRYFGDAPLDQIKPEHVEQFELWRIKQKKARPRRRSRNKGHHLRRIRL